MSVSSQNIVSVRKTNPDGALESPINRKFFDKQHPFELVGERLSGWNLKLHKGIDKLVSAENSSTSSELTIQEVRDNVRRSFYSEIQRRFDRGEMSDEHCKNTEINIYKYVDAKSYKDSKGRIRQDRERLYLKITRETLRGTLVTVFCRVLTHGNSLYIAVDSFALGELKVSAVVLQSVLLLIIIPIALSAFGWILAGIPLLFSGLFQFNWQLVVALGQLVAGVLVLNICYGYFSFAWANVVKALAQKEPWKTALRQGFHHRLTTNAFDVDDTLAFLKTLWPLIIDSMSTALNENGLQEESTSQYLKEIATNSKSQGITVNGGSGILNFMFGGEGNQIQM